MIDIISGIFILFFVGMAIWSAINNNKLFKMAILANLYATKYSFKYDIDIEARRQKDDSKKWVIYHRGEVWNKDTKCWDWEPMPSSRTDEFLQQTRFNTFDEAYKCYQKTVSPLIQAEIKEMNEKLAQRKMKQSSPTTNT